MGKDEIESRVLVWFEDIEALDKQDLRRILILNFIGEIGQKLLVIANINNRLLEELDRLSKNVSLRFYKEVFKRASLIYSVLKQFIGFEKEKPESINRYATIVALANLLIEYAQDYGNYLIKFSVEEMQKLGAIVKKEGEKSDDT